MTRAAFRLAGDRIESVEISGHSGYAPAGEDIVCAGVSSAVMLTHTLLSDIMGLEFTTRVQAEQARIFFQLPAKLELKQEQQAQDAMTALMVHLTGLQEQYPDYLSVVEV